MSSHLTSRSHLLAELDRLDVLVRAAAHDARYAPAGGGELRGLHISDVEIDGILAEPLGCAASSPLSIPELRAAFEERTADVEARAVESARAGASLRLPALARTFELTRFDVDAILLCLLPEIDRRVERLYGYLQDDLTRRLPSVDLVSSLLCPSLEERLTARARFAAGAPLLRHALVHVVSTAPRDEPLLSQPLKLDERIVAHLLGSDDIDPRLSPFVYWATPDDGGAELAVPRAERDRLSRFLAASSRRGDPAPILYLEGPKGSGKRALAEAISRDAGAMLLVVDCAALRGAGEETTRTLCRLACREAALSGAVVYWSAAGALLSAAEPAARAAFAAAVSDHRGAALLGCEAAVEPPSALAGRASLRVALPKPSSATQLRLWRAALAAGARAAEDVDLDALVSTFRFNAGQIREAARGAETAARLRDPDAGVTMQDLTCACRARSSHELSSLARRVPARRGWDDLVLPPDRKEQLEEICNHVRHRAKVLSAWGFDEQLGHGTGLAALFAGPPGTGKTMAAAILAGALEMDLHHVDLSMVVSKYIGETEKHLGRLFAEAEASSAILFFDEADALFGKRSEVRDAHDRNANMETSYLLQRIEAHEGVVILSSNFTKNMDDAFLRRLRFVVDFPLPEEPERRRIWERIWPDGAPRAPDLDLELLAKRLDVAGGHIRNIALNAAFLAAAEGAAVGMDHVIRAARREYQKMGKVVDRRDLVRR